MRKVLIADDEKIERDGIKFLLNQSGFDLHIEEAVNGKAALLHLQKNPVDILLTDVKMPFIDGLTLVKEALKNQPNLKCIIFSGFSEFEFAQKAIKLGVYDYVLKPVDPASLKSCMIRVLEELDEQDANAEARQNENEFIREHILYQLINGVLPEVLAQRNKLFEDISFAEKYQRMILIESSVNFFETVASILPVEIKNEIGAPFCYINLNMQQSVLMLENDSIDCISLAKRLYKWLKDAYSANCYLAVSGPILNIRDISSVYSELEMLMENKFYQPENHVFVIQEVKSGADQETSDGALTEMILLDIRNKNVYGLRNNFEALCERYKSNKIFSHIYIKYTFSNIIKEISRKLPGFDRRHLEKDMEQLYKSELITEVTDIAKHYIDLLAKSLENDGVRNEVQTIKNYIYENYQKDITIETLAQEVFLSPSYLSYIFKKDTGCNVSKFIKSYRMERAKELLRNTQRKVVDICEQVGYTSVSYFGQNFKEMFGKTPEKYRQSGDYDEKNYFTPHN